MKWFLECIERLFHTSPTKKSGTLKNVRAVEILFHTCLPQPFFTVTELEQKYGI